MVSKKISAQCVRLQSDDRAALMEAVADMADDFSLVGQKVYKISNVYYADMMSKDAALPVVVATEEEEEAEPISG